MIGKSNFGECFDLINYFFVGLSKLARLGRMTSGLGLVCWRPLTRVTSGCAFSGGSGGCGVAGGSGGSDSGCCIRVLGYVIVCAPVVGSAAVWIVDEGAPVGLGVVGNCLSRRHGGGCVGGRICWIGIVTVSILIVVVMVLTRHLNQSE